MGEEQKSLEVSPARTHTHWLLRPRPRPRPRPPPETRLYPGVTGCSRPPRCQTNNLAVSSLSGPGRRALVGYLGARPCREGAVERRIEEGRGGPRRGCGRTCRGHLRLLTHRLCDGGGGRRMLGLWTIRDVESRVGWYGQAGLGGGGVDMMMAGGRVRHTSGCLGVVTGARADVWCLTVETRVEFPVWMGGGLPGVCCLLLAGDVVYGKCYPASEVGPKGC